MTTREGSVPPIFTAHHHHRYLSDWLEDSIPFPPSFLDEPYSIPNDITAYDWWTRQQDQNQDRLHPLPPSTTTVIPQPELSKKRKLPTNPTTTHRRRIAHDDADGYNSSDSEIHRKLPVNTGRKTSCKGNGANSNNNGNKEVRWAEQLLNPLAAAIDASDLSRVQHLLYVLKELASPIGDANHRLASHGLRALTHHLSTSTGVDQIPTPTFANTEPKLFRSALIKFHEVSPWFAFPNSLANASILQTLTLDSIQRPRNLHIVDIGVSHGIQWPTLLEALTRRPNGVPALVRLTLAGDAFPSGPFAAAAPGYDFPSHLLRYAKSIDLNLKIDRVGDLTARSLSLTGDETLVVCAQFRAHHGDSDQRTAFIKSVRDLDPDLVVLSEIDGSEEGLGFASGFAKRAEMLWRFLDSTSAAFKGRDCVERKVMEGEAARVLEGGKGEGEGRERWRERMSGLGFREEGFGEEAVEAGRALLRKYDGNWEMRVAQAAVGVGLWWKGQPVSFCLLWKPVEKGTKVLS